MGGAYNRAQPRTQPNRSCQGPTAPCDITLMASRPATSTLQYEAHETPPLPVTVGLSVQTTLLVIAPAAVFPIVLVQAVDGSAAEVAWGVFAMLTVTGAVTAIAGLPCRAIRVRHAGERVSFAHGDTLLHPCVARGRSPDAGIADTGVGGISDCDVPAPFPAEGSW